MKNKVQICVCIEILYQYFMKWKINLNKNREKKDVFLWVVINRLCFNLNETDVRGPIWWLMDIDINDWAQQTNDIFQLMLFLCLFFSLFFFILINFMFFSIWFQLFLNTIDYKTHYYYILTDQWIYIHCVYFIGLNQMVLSVVRNVQCITYDYYYCYYCYILYIWYMLCVLYNIRYITMFVT